jgi:hypothetical protein
MSAFINDVVDPFHHHLEKFWLVEQIEKSSVVIRLRTLPTSTSPQSRKIWMLTITKRSSMTVWDNFMTRFLVHRQFCGGLASAFSNIALVESDCFVINWEKDAHRTGLTSLSLAGVLHSKQFNVLSGLFYYF